MKKLLGFMVMGLLAILPLSVKAAGYSISPSCGEKDADGNVTCNISYNITVEDGVDSLTVNLVEHGGAEISKVVNALDSEWTVDEATKDDATNTWTITLTSPSPISGEGNLFQFTYKVSGEEDCKVDIKLGDDSVTVTPKDPEPDKPAEQKPTGSTLPYIALGTIAVGAVVVYIATKNKTKMYKI